jgi:acetylornithine deacetylase/succinyl-diaminopimelate desuccinylase-like protein
MKAIEALLANGKPTVNVKFLIEGEEEIGSPNLGKFVAANRDLLMADVCVISDGSVIALDRPSIGYSTRGLMYLEMEVFGAKQDLHSGAFGGIVHNPAQALAEIIAQLHNPDGSVAVPSFYDSVVPLSTAEREELAKSAWTEAEWKDATGVPAFWGEADYLLHERIGARPTLEINGMVSGFYGAGSKTVLPGKALAKISCRLVANQNADHIFGLVRDYILKLSPPTIRVEVRQLASAGPALMDLNSPYMAAASRAYENGWGQKPVYERGGGTLPVLADFQRELNQIPIMLMGFGLQTDGAHGPNEHFVLEMFKRGIDTAICFFDEVGQIK